MLSADAQIWATVFAYVGLLVGCAGIIFPVLPGSILNLIVFLAWAFAVGSTAGWTMGGIAMGLTVIGMSASWFLTGKRLKDIDVPNRVIAIAGIAAVIGLFVLPGPGLVLGFVIGLFIAEWTRHSEAEKAWRSTWATLKAIGIGMLIELTCAALAFMVFTAGVIWHFAAA